MASAKISLNEVRQRCLDTQSSLFVANNNVPVQNTYTFNRNGVRFMTKAESGNYITMKNANLSNKSMLMKGVMSQQDQKTSFLSGMSSMKQPKNLDSQIAPSNSISMSAGGKNLGSQIRSSQSTHFSRMSTRTFAASSGSGGYPHNEPILNFFGMPFDAKQGLSTKQVKNNIANNSRRSGILKMVPYDDQEPFYNEEPSGFYRDEEGYLMCDNIRVNDIFSSATYKPFYLMSKTQLNKNLEAYQVALRGLDSAFIGYAVKANHNMHVLRHLANRGCGAVLVSGNEMKTAIRAGFNSRKMVFNGNGKKMDELIYAVSHSIMVNIDSEFDLEHIMIAAQLCNTKARCMLRINPDVDPKVHPYMSVGLAGSKFGIQNSKLPEYLEKIKENKDRVELLGAHCHIGSTITDTQIFKDAATKMVEYIKMIRAEGFDLQYLNIGGGLGIDYTHNPEVAKTIPTPKDLIDSVRDQIEEMNLKLIIEPGRSMVADTTVLVSCVQGVKSNGNKNFIVVDGSMSEMIRPSLYSAYHHIEFAGPHPEQADATKYKTYDVVGPVCESADFLGKDRELPEPREGEPLVVYDAGAYCQVMSSNYNMKLTAPEYWVQDDTLYQIRKDPELDQYLSVFDIVQVPMKVKNNKKDI